MTTFPGRRRRQKPFAPVLPDLSHPLNAGAKLWLPMVENMGPTTFDVAGRQVATLAGVAGTDYQWTGGECGPGINFISATADISLPSTHPAASIGAPMTVMVRCKHPALMSGSLAIIEKSPVNAAWELFMSGGVIKYRGSVAGDRASQVVGGTTLDNANEHTIGFTDDGATATIYVDGLAVGTGTSPSPPSATPGAIHIGSLDGTIFNFTGGTIYGARIWGQALSPPAMLAFHLDQSAGALESPVKRFFGVSAPVVPTGVGSLIATGGGIVGIGAVGSGSLIAAGLGTVGGGTVVGAGSLTATGGGTVGPSGSLPASIFHMTNFVGRPL